MHDILKVILILEAELIGLFVLLLLVGKVLTWVDRRVHPVYPFCDIDPLCHSAFALDKDGNGWIGTILVIPRESSQKGD